MIDHEGKEVPGNRGYKYFGAARDLPGVRELFEKKRKLYWTLIIFDTVLLAAKPPRLTRGDLARCVNADYYGYRDEDDTVIIPLEEEEERKGMVNAVH